MALKTGALSFLRETFHAFLRLPTSLSGPRPFSKLQTHVCPQGTHDWPPERREIAEVQLTWLPFPAGEAQVDTVVREGVIKVKG